MTNHTAWMVKFVMNLVLLTFFDQCKLVASTKFNTNLKFGVVNNTKTDKKRVDNSKFKTNLTIQVVCAFPENDVSFYKKTKTKISNLTDI